MLIASSVGAYNLLPYAWSGSAGITTLRACVSGAATAAYANQALLDWNATATDFGYTGDCSSPQIHFQDAYVVANWDGRMVSSGSGSTITKATIQLNRYFIEGNNPGGAPYAYGAARGVANHELGHGLTLDHNDDYAVMHSITCAPVPPVGPTQPSRWCWYGIETPVGDDIQGVNARY
jgi:hypothetical protein